MGKTMFNVGGVVFLATAGSLIWNTQGVLYEAEFWYKLALHTLLFSIAFALCAFGDKQIKTTQENKKAESAYKLPEVW